MYPLVAITCCYQEAGGIGYDSVFRKYTEAVAAVAGALPLLLPALGDHLDIDALIAGVDGLVLTGSPSNVEPWRYHGPSGRPGVRRDPRRDATTLPLIPRAVAAGVPVLALCRGHQELNVAYGGTLHEHVHELAGRLDHREDTSVPEAQRYEPVHEVTLTPGCYLARLLQVDRLWVNSLHAQGIDRVAAGLSIEARAPDGLVEAVRVTDAARLALGIQWHPEGRDVTTPGARRIFEAFGAACRERRTERAGGLAS